ncbi:MAG: rhomboid family intramembrane serine protease [Pseudomonadota bacterium]
MTHGETAFEEEMRFRQHLAHLPTLTLVAVACNAALYFLMAHRAQGLEASLPHLLLLAGAKVDPLIRDGELWRLFASAFLHGSFWHMTMNVLGILTLGWYMENASGPYLYVVLYLGSALGAAGTSYLLGDVTSVGASGVLFGLMGATATWTIRHWRRLPSVLRTYALVIPAAATAASLFYGWSLDTVDSWAHLGGFVTGALLGLLAPFTRTRERVESPLTLAGAILGLVLLVSSLATMVDRLNLHLPPLEPGLQSLALKDGMLHTPAGPLWIPGRLDETNQCISEPDLSPVEVLEMGGVLCYTDPYFTAVLIGTEERMARVPMYQEAFLREHGDDPRTFRAMEFLFHRRGDGMVTGIAVFRPLLPRYAPLFQALAAAEPQ